MTPRLSPAGDAAAWPEDRPGLESALRCATCRIPVPEGAPHGPFCSARCKMVDLGRWFHEEYVVPGEPAVALDGLGGFEPVEWPARPDHEPDSEEGGQDERDA